MRKGQKVKPEKLASDMFIRRARALAKLKGKTFGKACASRQDLTSWIGEIYPCGRPMKNLEKLHFWIAQIDANNDLTGLLRRKPTKKLVDLFYESREWRELRYKALLKNNGKCELCGSGKHDGVKLHVDHIKPRSLYPDLQLVEDNLQVLCEDCNLGKSNKDDTDWR